MTCKVKKLGRKYLLIYSDKTQYQGNKQECIKHIANKFKIAQSAIIGFKDGFSITVGGEKMSTQTKKHIGIAPPYFIQGG